MKRLAAASLITMVASATTLLAAPQQQSSPSSDESRNTGTTTTTASGTTGLWFVPTSDVLPSKKYSVSFYRTNMDDGQGFSDISTFPATFAVGVGNRAELFGSWSLVTRIDRDTRPLFFNGTNPDGTGGGIILDYPRQRGEWVSKVGDLWLGGKINLISSAGAPAGFAVRAMVKAPTGSEATSSGSTDFVVDGIVSGRTSALEVSGYGGFISRGSPDGYTLTNGMRWGLGAGFPNRSNLGLKVTAELFGEQYLDDTITAPAGQFGADGSLVPTLTSIKSPVVASLGLTWQAPNGVFIGAAGSWNVVMGSREDAGAPNTPKDSMGLQVRIGFHPSGRRERVEPPPAAAPATPPPAAAAAPAPAAPANRPPTVKAQCNPCSVETGRTSVVTADAQDPDGDPLTYQWTAPSGTLSAPTTRQSNWTAPNTPGAVQLTVTVNDGRGGTASSNVTIQVTAPTQLTFEDVHFEFDRFNLRQDALQVLDQAITAMQANPTLRMTIEGHTCNIGTPEYNLALGERRARSVRDYMTSRGIAATRLTTVSYGEERPKFDNSREETRRLNRRAALTVTLQ